ncbi:MAG: T9SS type A sorting domain-containing protein, partial [Bacteroidales bacterium]
NDITSTNTDLSLQQPFTVYPNPADDHISIGGPLIPGMIIEILNPNGILYKRWIVERESNNINLDISEIPAGLSLVKINETVIKLIVQ